MDLQDLDRRLIGKPLTDYVFDHAKMRAAIQLAMQRLAETERTQPVGLIVPTLLHIATDYVGTTAAHIPVGGIDWVVWLPQFLESLSTEQVAYAISHEAAHVYLDSEATFYRLLGDKEIDYEKIRCFNVAADFEIYQLLDHMADMAPPNVIRLDKYGFCRILGKTFDFPRGRDSEYYYTKLQELCDRFGSPVRSYYRVKARQQGKK